MLKLKEKVYLAYPYHAWERVINITVYEQA